jgi:thiopurine S-methyltransferase
MQHEFWHDRWESNQIGFHLPEANPLLVKHLTALNLKSTSNPNTSARIFLPLCGKTLDIAWLLAQGHRVIGAELSQIAIENLFSDLKLTPTITTHDDFTHYSAPNIDIFVGDIFNMTPALLGQIDLIYDRAALVALPEDMRKRYTKHLLTLTDRATPQLLICFEYDQNLHGGPPFSVNAAVVKLYYQSVYDIHLLERVTMVDGLKGKYPATEHVWLLTPHSQ